MLFDLSNPFVVAGLIGDMLHIYSVHGNASCRKSRRAVVIEVRRQFKRYSERQRKPDYGRLVIY